MSLRSTIMLSVAAALAVAFAVVAWMFSVGLSSYTRQTALAAVETRSNALATFVSRALYEEWQNIEKRAAQISPTDSPGSMQAIVEALAADDDKISWVGIARADGTVLAASRGLLAGENVASRPWFSEGLKGSFAGDVHEAVLLARLLNPVGREPLRFVDFAAPLRNADGTVWGVLGTHVNWRWVRGLVQTAAAELSLDTFVLNAAGTVILSTGPASDDLEALSIFRSASLGSPGSSYETWPDGKTYYATTISERSYETLPPFGWRYIMRLDPQLVFGSTDAFRMQTLFSIALALLAAFLMLALIVGFLTRPLGLLLNSLLRLSRGEAVGYHRERSRYRELATLSEAIARLQSRPTAPLSDAARDDTAD